MERIIKGKRSTITDLAAFVAALDDLQNY